jgi:hypothetical protein
MSNPKPPILVWKFEDAPEIYRSLSTAGGDEDWIAFVPKIYEGKYIPWLEVGPFGVCDVELIRVADGEVYIGSHA